MGTKRLLVVCALALFALLSLGSSISAAPSLNRPAPCTTQVTRFDGGYTLTVKNCRGQVAYTVTAPTGTAETFLSCFLNEKVFEATGVDTDAGFTVRIDTDANQNGGICGSNPQDWEYHFEYWNSGLEDGWFDDSCEYTQPYCQ